MNTVRGDIREHKEQDREYHVSDTVRQALVAEVLATETAALKAIFTEMLSVLKEIRDSQA